MLELFIRSNHALGGEGDMLDEVVLSNRAIGNGARSTKSGFAGIEVNDCVPVMRVLPQ